MGHIYTQAKLISPSNGVEIAVEALVDTGASWSVIPLPLAERLGLSPFTRRRVRTASGEEELPVSYLFIEIEGERGVSEVLVSGKLDQVLIGVFTLESLVLKVDPTTGKLEKGELLLY